MEDCRRRPNPFTHPRCKFLFCLGFALLGIACKFWLIADLEITDASDDPHEYALQILHPENGGLAYPPGTGLVGRLFYDARIPFRLGIETLFILATALALRALLAWPHRSYLSLGLFLLTILNPNPAEEFSHLMSDQVWLVETMAGLSCFVLALERDVQAKWLWLGLAIVLLGLTVVTRSTFVPLIVSLVLFIGIVGLVFFLNRKSGSSHGQRPFFFVFAWLLLCGVSFIYYGTCLYDARRYGYFGISAIDCREYRNFYTCLQSVGDSDDDPYFPIDENRRRLIQQAGPTSRWFVGELENNRVYTQVGLDLYGKADLPAGWFHFATFNAVLPATGGDLRQAYALLGTIEAEISQANRDGRLKVRTILPLPDSRLHVVLAELPGALGHTSCATLYQPPATSFAWPSRMGKFANPDFTQALTRRTVEESPAREKTWAVLCAIYSRVYRLPFFLLLPASLAIWLILCARQKFTEEISLFFLAQQLFVIFFVVHLLWYTLFDASGLAVFTRYLLFQNIMLPVLIAYYFKAIGHYLSELPSKPPL